MIQDYDTKQNDLLTQDFAKRIHSRHILRRNVVFPLPALIGFAAGLVAGYASLRVLRLDDSHQIYFFFIPFIILMKGIVAWIIICCLESEGTLGEIHSISSNIYREIKSQYPHFTPDQNKMREVFDGKYKAFPTPVILFIVATTALGGLAATISSGILEFHHPHHIATIVAESVGLFVMLSSIISLGIILITVSSASTLRDNCQHISSQDDSSDYHPGLLRRIRVSVYEQREMYS